jgi:hypothetical protein
MSDQITLPPEFEFFRKIMKVRPLTADEEKSLTPLCERYANWTTRHGVADTRNMLSLSDEEARREYFAILREFEQWGLWQSPPFIRHVIDMTEARRRELVAELSRSGSIPDAGHSPSTTAAEQRVNTGGANLQPEMTTADSPSRWAKMFGISLSTLKRRFADGSIRHKKLSTKSYQIAIDDLPAKHQGKFRAQPAK